ncbi:hypothetical protein Tco_0137486, partial [Tanacetum coccineum]
MMDAYDDQVKDDPVARRRACFARLDKCKIISQGRVIHSPKKASISAISHIFPNNNLEDSFKYPLLLKLKQGLFLNKELNKEILIPIPRESKIGKDCDFSSCNDFQSFFKTFSNPLFEKQDDFPSRNDESILKEEVHEEALKSYLNPLFEDDEEIISIEVSRQIFPKVLDFTESGDSTSIITDPPSFTPFEGSEMILEEEIEEFLKHDESLNMDLNDDEGDVIYLETLIEVLNDDPFSQLIPPKFKKQIKNVESVKTSIEEP